TSNNQVTILPVVLPLGVDDPVELLAQVHQATMIGKQSLSTEITDSLVSLVTRLVPNVVQEAAAEVSGPLMGYFGDTCITNVPGPPIPMYVLGRQIQAQYPVLPVAEPILFGVAITSLN